MMTAMALSFPGAASVAAPDACFAFANCLEPLLCAYRWRGTPVRSPTAT